MSQIYNIESHLPFAENFAKGLMQHYPNDLPNIHIYLPTVRAIKSLTDAFLKLNNGKPILLPVMYSLADVPEDEMDFTTNIINTGDIPNKVIGKQERLFLLAQLVSVFLKEKKSTPANVIALTRSLEQFLDMMQINEVPLGNLENLVPQDYASHWNEVLKFLFILKDRWQPILQDKNLNDIMQHGNEQLDRLGEFLLTKGLSDTRKAVIVAGTTGSRSAVRRFAKLVANLPHGAVVLPGVDEICTMSEWEAVKDDACHAQYHLYHFLHELGLQRDNLKTWHEGEGNKERLQFLSFALRSEKVKEKAKYDGNLQQALENFHSYDCDNENEEAQLIAYHMREVLMTKDKTAALVTPSRRLSDKVATELKRWDINVEVSAGQYLSQSQVGQYLKLISDTCESNLRPIKLLGLLQHSLSAAGMAKHDCIYNTTQLERHLLRGAKPDKSFAGLRKRILTRTMQDRNPLNEKAAKKLHEFIDILQEKLSPLSDLQNERPVPLSDILHAHLQAAENFAATDKISGATNLWKGEDGIRLANLLAEAMPHANSMGEIKPSDYPDFFKELINGESFSQPYSHHPRLFIWGTMEARLQSADVMILGGLDEDVWPQTLPADPWMSPSMRQSCGLPPVEHRIGLSAHDFWQSANGGGEVILTRSKKREGTPMAAARWLERIQALLKQHDFKQEEDSKRQHIRQLLNGENSGKMPLGRPHYCPPIDARPKGFYITDFAKLRQDPYAIYARKILSLSALDDVEEPQEAAIKGKLIHTILERTIEESDFEKIAEDEMRKITLPASEEKFLRHKLKEIGNWFLARQENKGRQIICEERGEMQIGDWIISGRADRIDIDENNLCTIIDYKSGTASSGTKIIEAIDPQLPLEAVMIQQNAFPKITSSNEVKALQIWRTAGQFEPFAPKDKQGGEIVQDIHGDKLQTAIDNAKILVHSLQEIFADETSSYLCFPDANFPADKRYNNYAYFERLDEWAIFGDGDE